MDTFHGIIYSELSSWYAIVFMFDEKDNEDHFVSVIGVANFLGIDTKHVCYRQNSNMLLTKTIGM